MKLEIELTARASNKNPGSQSLDCVPEKVQEEYKISRDGDPVGKFSIDHFPTRSCLSLYEIYVEPEYRHQGIAGEALKRIEKVATDYGCKVIVLRVKPYGKIGLSKEELVKWYKRRGFIECESNDDHLKKMVSGEFCLFS